MKKLRDLFALSAVLVIIGLAALFTSTPASATNPTNTNDVEYWENLYEDQFPNLQCYKHDSDKASNAHGYIEDDEVVLNEFNPDWYGDKFVLLVIKAGSSGHSVEDENRVITNPESGVGYEAPSGKAVSHWIVCKGYDNEVTTTTTVEETTTTTAPETTTTTEPETTTTTGEVTTTTVGDTTTTAGDTTTTSVVVTTTTPTVAETDVTVAGLPVTGVNPFPIFLVGVGLIGLGICLVLGVKHYQATHA